jgi:integrase
MPRDRIPHTHRETARGKTFWYYRRGHGPRTRLRGAWGSAEFMAAYRAADAGEVATRRRKDEGTFGWLWTLYRASPAWERLSPATKKQRDNLMRLSLERAGNQPLERWDRGFIIRGCDARAATPAQARNFLGVLRALFQWAVSREHVEVDPTVGVKVERLRGDGFHAWTAEELARFEERWPVGTRERLAYDLMLWTGLRRGDAAIVGPQHVKDGVITLKTAKTGAPVTIRILPPLARSIAATQVGKESFVTRGDGRPMVKEGFGNWFGEACRAASVPGSAHGLRKALAIKLAEAGSTPSEMDALMGWSGGGMSSLYARKASRERLADAALSRLGIPERENETT